MTWFNYYGLIFMALIMIPNIIYAIKNKEGSSKIYKNKAVEIFEQIGRYGCMALMIFNIPYVCFGFWFKTGLILYLSIDGGLCLAYIIFWIICRNRNGYLKALSLSVIPSCIFIFSGVVLAYIPLIAFALLFGINHILISCKSIP